jgi:hypothetical protein
MIRIESKFIHLDKEGSVTSLFRLLLCLIVGTAGNFAWAQSSESEGNPTTIKAALPSAPKYMFGYSFYHYEMEGNRTAATNIYKFGNATTDLHLISATWLYSPKWTFVAIAPIIKNVIEMVYEPGKLDLRTTEITEGIGDIRLMAVSPILATPSELWVYDVSVTAPTGPIDRPFSSSKTGQRASYNMQPGTGTPDLIAGTTFTYTAFKKWASSARGQVTVRGGKNAEGWALGNEAQINLASKYQVNPYANLGLVWNFKSRGAVQGRDPMYERANNYYDQKTGVSGDGHQYYHEAQTNHDLSIVGKLQSPTLGPVALSLEGGLPLYQQFINKDNVDLNTKFWAAVSANGTF